MLIFRPILEITDREVHSLRAPGTERQSFPSPGILVTGFSG